MEPTVYAILAKGSNHYAKDFWLLSNWDNLTAWNVSVQVELDKYTKQFRGVQ